MSGSNQIGKNSVLLVEGQQVMHDQMMGLMKAEKQVQLDVLCNHTMELVRESPSHGVQGENGEFVLPRHPEP